MANIVYNVDVESVDSIFFAVVPDSFMAKETGSMREAREWDGAEEWSEERDQPLLSPHDRWSF